MDGIKKGFVSVGNFAKLVFKDNLHRSKVRLGRSYQLVDHGEYKVFRETLSRTSTTEKPVVLMVGFRLKLLGNSQLLHWLFRKVCILTTPFWSGFKGFKVKLWMYQPKTNKYIGIYNWSGKQNAQNYVDWLIHELKPLSIDGSVWHKIYETDFEDYLEKYEYRIP